MVWMRQRVERLLRGTAGKRGRPLKDDQDQDKVAVSNLNTMSSDLRARILARLDRGLEDDGPHPEYAELAAKVRAREMSARAAKLSAGWKRERDSL